MLHTLTVFRFTQFYAQKLVADLSPAEMTLMPAPRINHPAWILGHLVLGADFVPKLLGQPMLTDAAWMQQFGPGSTPIDDPSQYPTREVLLAKLAEVYDRGVLLAQGATAEQLAAINQTPFFQVELPTIGDLLTHILSTHPAAHCGQLSTWRKVVGKASVLGV
jgi:hypothetical protein